MFDLTSLGNIEQFLPFVLIFVAFYFLLIRPQQKRAQDLKRMIESVRRGDTIVTAGGMLGKVNKVFEDGTAQVEIAENVRVRVVKSTIAEVRSRGEAVGKSEPAAANDSKSTEGGSVEPAKKSGLFSVFKK
jgi:preprotein translocase subunit YajC